MAGFQRVKFAEFFSTDFVASCEKKHNLLSFSSFCDLLEKCDSAK